MLVINHDTAAYPVFAYAADGLTSDHSGEYYSDRNTPLQKAGLWVKVGESSLTVPASTTVRVPFTISVPADATPGDHLAAVVFEAQSPSSDTNAVGVAAIYRAAMPLVITVPGPASFHLALSGAQIQAREGIHTSTILVAMSNDGRLKGKSTMSVHLSGPGGYDQTEPAPDCSSHGDGRFCGQLDYVLPGDTIHYPFPWFDDLQAGDYTITVTAAWGPAPDQNTVLTVRSHLDSALPRTPIITPGTSVIQAGIAGASSGSGFLGWLLHNKVFLGAVFLTATGCALLLGLLIRRRRCTHCGSVGLVGRFQAQDYHEIAGCASCRSKAIQRVHVVLCQRCYRSHVRTVDLSKVPD